ncbi:MAG: DNA polymerase IV, partial [Xanthomonadales bacterium]|nr:DNA polymerase IV [Xanthomonadales bacterium]
IHIDMDCFYAAIEERDDPALRGKPIGVGGSSRRGVLTTANYEARKFGCRSAMPVFKAMELCPQLTLVPVRFDVYRAESSRIRSIFARFTELIEPLSLDEAYLDVTENKRGVTTATELAQIIRGEIFEETRLTASAGIAPNKFLAKVASDWNKPNGQFVVRPGMVEAFLRELPVKRIPGVGKVMQEKLAALGIETVGQLGQRPLEELQARFGRWGVRLHQLSQGIDDRPVCSDSPRRSLSSEDTFATDIPLEATADKIRELGGKVWTAAERDERVARTVVLKLKTRDFRILTRSHTPPTPPASATELIDIALRLRERVELPSSTRYRLVGVGLDNFTDADDPRLQAGLFD